MRDCQLSNLGIFMDLIQENYAGTYGGHKRNLSPIYHYSIRRLTFRRAVCTRKTTAHFGGELSCSAAPAGCAQGQAGLGPTPPYLHKNLLSLPL